MQNLLETAEPVVGYAASGDAERDCRDLTDSELMRSIDEQFAMRREVDSTIVRLAAELDYRSRPSLGREGLAHRWMDTSPAASLTRIGRIDRFEASRFVKVAAATTSSLSITGEPIAPRYPQLAEALGDAAIGMAAAAVIITYLGEASPRAHPDDVAFAEQVTVDFARAAPLDLVRKLAIRCRDRLDTDGIEPREEELVRQRKLTITERANGMHRLLWDMDPLTAASVHTYLDGYIDNVFHAGKQKECPDPVRQILDGPPTLAEELRDPRTRPNLASDAMLALFGHVSNCAQLVSPMPQTTIVIRMTLESLLDGLGEATLDSIDQPISAATARRLAAEAGLIPVVLGGASEVLDMGRKQRLYGSRHRIAIAETYSVCVGCGAPAAWTELHHIEWWVRDGGETNLRNAIPVCSSCHHAVHMNGWEVSMRDGVPWFIPPSSIDAFRTPRRGIVIPRPDCPRRR